MIQDFSFDSWNCAYGWERVWIQYFFWKMPYILNMKINYSYSIEKKWLWWRAIVKHQQILKLCNLLPNYCNIVDIVARQCIVTMGVIGWTKGTLLSIGTNMVNMNFEQFHFMHPWFVRIELSCVELMNRIKNNKRAHLLPHRVFATHAFTVVDFNAAIPFVITGFNLPLWAIHKIIYLPFCK